MKSFKSAKQTFTATEIPESVIGCTGVFRVDMGHQQIVGTIEDDGTFRHSIEYYPLNADDLRELASLIDLVQGL